MKRIKWGKLKHHRLLPSPSFSLSPLPSRCRYKMTRSLQLLPPRLPPWQIVPSNGEPKQTHPSLGCFCKLFDTAIRKLTSIMLLGWVKYKLIVLLLQLPHFWVPGCQDGEECRHAGSAFLQCILCTKAGNDSQTFTSHLLITSLLSSHFKAWGCLLIAISTPERENTKLGHPSQTGFESTQIFDVSMFHSKSDFGGMYLPDSFIWCWWILSPVTHPHSVASTVSKWMSTR